MVMDYKKEIFSIIKSKTSIPFDENTNIRDLGLDSIDMIEMITDFEDKFDISIPSDKINGIKTIKDFIKIVENISK